MKLLLTSAGIYNKSIAKALSVLVGKSPSEVKIGYIPTSANGEAGNKDWVVKDFLNFWRYGYNWIDIVDPSASGVDWKSRLADVDVISLSGGNCFHLLNQVNVTGFGKWLKENLATKVYIGGSASSILVSPTIGVATIEAFHDENLPGLKDLTGLNLVDFEIVPHSPSWASYEDAAEYAKKASGKIYALDDMSAIKIDGDSVDVVTEGAWRVYNEK